MHHVNNQSSNFVLIVDATFFTHNFIKWTRHISNTIGWSRIITQWGMFPWWPLLVLLSWWSIFKWSHRNSFQVMVPTHRFYLRVPYFQMSSNDLTRTTGFQDSSQSNGRQVTYPIVLESSKTRHHTVYYSWSLIEVKSTSCIKVTEIVIGSCPLMATLALLDWYPIILIKSQ